MLGYASYDTLGGCGSGGGGGGGGGGGLKHPGIV